MKFKIAPVLADEINKKLSSSGIQVSFSADQVFESLELPKNSDHGDLAFPCFQLSKIVKRSPQDVAKDFAAALSLPIEFVEATVVGGYLNFKFSQKHWQKEVLGYGRQEIKDIGASKTGQGKTVVIDYSSPNVAKPMSIGHLRSTVIGQALSNIFSLSGYKVVGINYLGDWGVQFGKLAWAHLNLKHLLELAKKNMDKVIQGGFNPEFWNQLVARASLNLEQIDFDYLFSIYVIFHALEDFEPELQDQGRAYFLMLEKRNLNKEDSLTQNIVQSWKDFVDVSLKEYKKVYELLGTSHDLIRGESYYENHLAGVVEELKNKNLLQESDGAQVVDLTELGTPPCLIQKKDGATLYATRDIAAAINRKSEFKADKLLYVVGEEQSLHFKQVFKVLEKMGYEWSKNCHHVAFGLYRFKDGKMSTRRGNVVLLEDVLDKAIDAVKAIIKEKNPDLKNADSVARDVGTAAIVFNDLMNDRQKNIDFDWDKVLDFNGDTGPYIQYTQVRCTSVLARWNKPVIKSEDALELKEKLEKAVIKLLGQFDSVVATALHQLKPSWVAQYLLELSKAYNAFYYEHRILEGDENLQKSRVLLTAATQRTLEAGLSVLGIRSPQAM